MSQSEIEAGEVPEPGEELDVVLINRTQRIAILTDSSSVPVTNWFDWRGYDCEPEHALSCVAGSDEAGWFCIDLCAFDYATVH